MLTPESFALVINTASFLIISGTVLLVAVISLLIGVYIHDRLQSRHAVLRNYPVIGHFRYIFEFLGHFFRQYFFSADRDELPFNRATRSWVYQAAKDVDSTVAFGSTRNITEPGTIIFSNAAFPTLKKNALDSAPMTIGASCKHPYLAPSFFNVSAMSYGAISKPAIYALTSGAQVAGSWVNTGEGGISPYHLSSGCDLIAQIGTAKYGYRDEEGNLNEEKLKQAASYPQVKMFEIKLSQGAKPGKGGLLPGNKVTEEIAQIRGIPVGKDSISPNRFPELSNNQDILDMVNKVRKITGKPVGVKFVLGDKFWFKEFCKDIVNAGVENAPDFITLDSADGGTGAAPLALIDYVGLHLKESLPFLIDTLIEHNLKDRIKVIASGKMITPPDVAWALAVGADFINSARGFMFALGCIQALQCNKNTCPTGITTHNKRLQKGLVAKDKATRVANYIRNMQTEVSQIAHSCGVKEPRLLNRTHCRIVQDNGVSISLAELYRKPNI